LLSILLTVLCFPADPKKWQIQDSVDEFTGSRTVQVIKIGFLDESKGFINGYMSVAFWKNKYFSIHIFLPKMVSSDGVFDYRFDSNEIQTAFWQRTDDRKGYCSEDNDGFISNLLLSTRFLARIPGVDGVKMTISIDTSGFREASAPYWKLTNR
jgi:hypothetical protein